MKNAITQEELRKRKRAESAQLLRKKKQKANGQRKRDQDQQKKREEEERKLQHMENAQLLRMKRQKANGERKRRQDQHKANEQSKRDQDEQKKREEEERKQQHMETMRKVRESQQKKREEEERKQQNTEAVRRRREDHTSFKRCVHKMYHNGSMCSHVPTPLTECEKADIITNFSDYVNIASHVCQTCGVERDCRTNFNRVKNFLKAGEPAYEKAKEFDERWVCESSVSLTLTLTLNHSGYCLNPRLEHFKAPDNSIELRHEETYTSPDDLVTVTLAVCKAKQQNRCQELWNRMFGNKTLLTCKKCLTTKHWCSFSNFEPGRIPADLQALEPNILERAILSKRIWSSKGMKLNGKFEGTVVCIKSTLEEEVASVVNKLPRKNALEYISAQFVGGKEKLGGCANDANKLMRGLKA